METTCSRQKIRLVLDIIEDHFGDITKDVAEVLLLGEQASLSQLCRHFSLPTHSQKPGQRNSLSLSLTQIRHALLVLNQHNCLQAELPPEVDVQGDTLAIATDRLKQRGLLYRINADMVILRLSLAKSLFLVQSIFGCIAVVVYEELIAHGRLRVAQIKKDSTAQIMNIISRLGARREQEEFLDSDSLEQWDAEDLNWIPHLDKSAEQVEMEVNRVFEQLVQRRLVIAVTPLEIKRQLLERKAKAAKLLAAAAASTGGGSHSMQAGSGSGSGSAASKAKESASSKVAVTAVAATASVVESKRKRKRPEDSEVDSQELPMEMRLMMAAASGDGGGGGGANSKSAGSSAGSGLELESLESIGASFLAGGSAPSHPAQPSQRGGRRAAAGGAEGRSAGRGGGRGRGAGRGRGLEASASASSTSAGDGGTSALLTEFGPREDALWTIGWDQIIRERRHLACIRFVTDRMEALAGSIVKVILLRSMNSEVSACQPRSCNVSAAQILEMLKAAAFTGSGSGIPAAVGSMDLNMLKKLLELMRLDTSGIVSKVPGSEADNGGPSYFVNMSSIITVLQRKTIHGIAVERYGMESARLIELFNRRSYLEQTRIGDLVIMPAKEARERLYRLYQDRWVDYLDISKRPDFNPATTSYFWFTNKNRVHDVVVDTVFQALFNLRRRSAHEYSIGKSLVEFGDADPVRYSEFLSKMNRLDKAVVKLDSTLVLLHSFS